MGLSLVRCPFCDRRYNVTGIPPGTRVLCTSCRTVLTVPGNRFVAPPPFWHRFVPRSGAAQLTSAVFGGLLLAGACYLALKESQHPALAADPPAGPSAPLRAPDPEPKGGYPSMNVSDSLREFLSRVEKDKSLQIYSSPQLGPFILVGEKNPEADLPTIFSKYENLLPKLYRTFMKEFGEPLNLEWIERAELPIVFYTRRKTYDDWWRRVYSTASIPDVQGVFSFTERRVSIYYDLALERLDPGRSDEVLLHESIHQLVDHYTRRRKKADKPGAWWFQEGLGSYFEGFYHNSGELTLTSGKMNSRQAQARELVEKPEIKSDYVPLQKLMSWTADAIWTDWFDRGTEGERQGQIRSLQCAYAESWALVSFLCNGQDGKYRDFFVSYFKSELEGLGGKTEFERLLSVHHHGMDLVELEKQFIEYLKKL